MTTAAISLNNFRPVFRHFILPVAGTENITAYFSDGGDRDCDEQAQNMGVAARSGFRNEAEKRVTTRDLSWLFKLRRRRLINEGFERHLDSCNNETFNTLKNQGYHFEHNYGHGRQHLATVPALLMFLAFTVDQIQQRCCPLFRRLHQGLNAKAKLRSSIRNLFNVLVFKSMDSLYQRLAANYRLQIE